MANAQEIISILQDAIDQSIAIPEITNRGKEIVLPEGMTAKKAIKALERRDKQENEMVQLIFDYDYYVWDGAYALARVMEERYGFVFGEVIKGGWFSPDQPPAFIGVESDLGKVEQVPWGNFTSAALNDALFQCGFSIKDGKINFKLTVNCKNMHRAEIKELDGKVRAYLKEHSIYKGKAISIRFNDDSGKPLLTSGIIPTPHFVDLSNAKESELVFSREVEDAIQTNLFTPIERMDEARKLGVPIKRGILLAGDYGVGKTFTAYVAAAKAIRKGITYIYCQNPQEFNHIMRFAAQYTPALVFCEDVDRIVPLDRDKAVDELINVVDGVETKNREIITVFTTNIIGNVNRALLRPGRMDAVIPISCPDAEAVVRLIHNYAGHYIEDNADLTEVGRIMQGQIPAVIREVCERSKLAALRFLKPGLSLQYIPVEAFRESATTMKMQLELLSDRTEAPKQPDVLAMEAVGHAIRAIAVALAQGRLGYYQLREAESLEDKAA